MAHPAVMPHNTPLFYSKRPPPEALEMWPLNAEACLPAQLHWVPFSEGRVGVGGLCVNGGLKQFAKKKS